MSRPQTPDTAAAFVADTVAFYRWWATVPGCGCQHCEDLAFGVWAASGQPGPATSDGSMLELLGGP